MGHSPISSRMLQRNSRGRAIIVAVLLIAVFCGGAIMWVNRYEVAEQFNPNLFERYDRWTGRVELCSSYFDGKTYCGFELERRAGQAIKGFTRTDRSLAQGRQQAANRR